MIPGSLAEHFLNEYTEKNNETKLTTVRMILVYKDVSLFPKTTTAIFIAVGPIISNIVNSVKPKLTGHTFLDFMSYDNYHLSPSSIESTYI